jgi:peptidyl-prolyl cis-trans isomerase A (cyclophilin A)
VNQDKNFVQIDVIQADTHPWKARSLHDPVALEPTSVTGLRHVDGTLSMARSSEKDSGNEQFFICIGDQPELDAGGKRHPDGFGFAAFGRVVEGMDVVRKIHLMDNEGQAIRIPVQMLSVKALP